MSLASTHRNDAVQQLQRTLLDVCEFNWKPNDPITYSNSRLVLGGCLEGMVEEGGGCLVVGTEGEVDGESRVLDILADWRLQTKEHKQNNIKVIKLKHTVL